MRVPETDPSMRQFSLELPWTEFTNKKKSRKKSINLNLYRNLHFQELSNQKNHFHDRMLITLKELPPLGAVWLHYEIFPGHRGRLDTMNVGSVVDKFFSDSLTEMGIIEDDDYTRVVFNSFCFGAVVKGCDPYIRVTITELEPRKQQNMRVLLDEHDIQEALETFVSKAGISGATGVKLAVVNDEITAEVLFGIQGPRVSVGANVPQTDEEDNDLPKPKNRGGRPAGLKNKPKEEVTEDVGTSAQGSSGRGAKGTQQAGGGASDEDDDDFLSTPKAKGGANKNPTTDSLGESSNESGTETGEEAKDVPAEDQPVKKSRSSIFDDD